MHSIIANYEKCALLSILEFKSDFWTIMNYE